jgi:hypothetical protein
MKHPWPLAPGRCTRTLLAGVLLVCAVASQAAVPSDLPEALRKVVADYVGLYRKDSLPRWRELFLASFTVASTEKGGGVRSRSLDEFYAAQKRYLDSGREIHETLEDLRIERSGRLASVSASFVLSDAGETSRGRLNLLLIEERENWKIQSLIFGYDEDE